MRHPEQREGELYLGNATSEEFSLSGWTTKRMGRVALYADGSNIGAHADVRPWFISAAEVRAAITASESAKGPNHKERVATYRAMLDELS